MQDLFKVTNLDIKDKIGNLKTETHSAVKSTKFFPVYNLNGKQMIFKPLSKTKPLTTPLFSYSEVFWSYVINKYFDSQAPRYYLAKIKGMTDEQEKYYESGVLVESLTPNGEKLINLYDFFLENPDPVADIKSYENYCMQYYDYTNILRSKFFSDNKEEGEKLAIQILLATLRQDQNFHYENINLINNHVAPPIDFEFSNPFLYPDNIDRYSFEQSKYYGSLAINYKVNEIIREFKKSKGESLAGTLSKNICLIVKLYPDLVLNFIKQLDEFIEDMPNIKFDDPDDYIGALNSDSWKIGDARLKEKNEEKASLLEKTIVLREIEKETTFNKIKKEILRFSKFLNLILKLYLLSYYNGIEDLENLTMVELLEHFGQSSDALIKDVDLDARKLILANNSQ